MADPKTFDDLVAENAWSFMHGITTGFKLSGLVRDVMLSTIEWHKAKAQDKPGFVDQLTRLNERLTFERDQLKEQVQNLTAEAERHRNNYNATTEQLAGVIEENVSLKVHLKDREGDSHRLVDENFRLKQELTAVKGELARADDDLKLKEARIKGLLRDIEDYQGEAEKLKQEVKDLQGVNEGLREAPMVIQTQMGSIIREISEQRDKAQQQLGECDGGFETLKKELAQAQQELTDMTGKRDSEKIRADIAVAQRGEYSSALVQAKALLAASEASREKLEKRIANLQNGILKIHEVADALTAQ